MSLAHDTFDQRRHHYENEFFKPRVAWTDIVDFNLVDTGDAEAIGKAFLKAWETEVEDYQL